MSVSIIFQARELEELAANNAWLEFQRRIVEQVDLTRDLLEDPTSDEATLRALQGQVHALRRILDLPDVMRSEVAEDDSEEELTDAQDE